MFEENMHMFVQWGLKVVAAVLILVAGWVIGNMASKSVRSIKTFQDETLKSFMGGLVKYAVLAIAIITVLAQFGVQTASLIAVLGAAGLAIGLALQGTLSNVASGVMLLVLRPFDVGDEIMFGTTRGTVTVLGLFATELSTADGDFIFAPNSTIWNKEIFNYTRSKRQLKKAA